MKKLFFVKLLLFLVIYACNKEAVVTQHATEPDNFPIHLDGASDLNTAAYIPLSSQDILDIAANHNTYLDSLLGLVDWDAPNRQAEIITQAKDLYDPAWGDLTEADYDSIVDVAEHTYLEVSQYITNTTDFKLIYDSIEYLGDNATTYSALSSDLDDLVTHAENTMTGRDLDATLVLLETARKSAHYWMDVVDGGLGGLEDFDHDNGPGNAPNLGGLLLADSASAALTFFLIGFLVVPTPVTLGALAVAVGVPAARASLAYLTASFF